MADADAQQRAELEARVAALGERVKALKTSKARAAAHGHPHQPAHTRHMHACVPPLPTLSLHLPATDTAPCLDYHSRVHTHTHTSACAEGGERVGPRQTAGSEEEAAGVIAELKDAKAALAQLGAAAEKKFELKTPKVRAYARTHRHTERERRTDIVIVRCKHVYASPLGASAYPCIGECALYPRIRGVGAGRKWLSLSPLPHGSPRRALSCLSRWCAMCRGLGLCDCVCVCVCLCVCVCVCVCD
jgi:hypothetical protein